MFNISPLADGTRERTDHNTFAPVVASYNHGVVVSGDQIWTAPADGDQVKAGDQWLHVQKVNQANVTPGWMAIIHKGQQICQRLPDSDDTIPDPTPTPDPDGVKRIIDSVITYEAFDGSIRTQRMVPE